MLRSLTPRPPADTLTPDGTCRIGPGLALVLTIGGRSVTRPRFRPFLAAGYLTVILAVAIAQAVLLFPRIPARIPAYLLVAYRRQFLDNRLRATLYWTAERPLRQNLTVSVQLLDPSGHWIAQQDSEPVGGRLPTSL